MLGQVVALASYPDAAEVLEQLDAEMATRPPLRLRTEDVLAARDGGRSGLGR